MERAGGYARIPNRLLQDETLSWQAKLVYCIGASYLSGTGREIYPSYKTLARMAGVSRSTVIRAAKELEGRGYWRLQFRRNEEMRCDTNVITYLSLPSSLQDPPSVPATTPSSTLELPSVPQKLGVVSEIHPNKTHVEQDPVKQCSTTAPTDEVPRLRRSILDAVETINTERFGRLVIPERELALLRGWFARGLALSQLREILDSRPRASCFAYLEKPVNEWLEGREARDALADAPAGPEAAPPAKPARTIEEEVAAHFKIPFDVFMSYTDYNRDHGIQLYLQQQRARTPETLRA
jgi:hypothetical protein